MPLHIKPLSITDPPPPSHTQLLLSRADIIICPTFWTATDGDPVGLSHNPDSEILYLESTITARAFENECVVVFVNAGGEKEAGYIGGSRVAVPFKGVIGGAKGGEEEMVLVKVDIGILEVSFGLLTSFFFRFFLLCDCSVSLIRAPRYFFRTHEKCMASGKILLRKC